MICPRRLSFSQFGVLEHMTNNENDILLGQTVPSHIQFFKIIGFFTPAYQKPLLFSPNTSKGLEIESPPWTLTEFKWGEF